MTKHNQLISLKACLDDLDADHAAQLRNFMPDDEVIALKDLEQLSSHPLREAFSTETLLSYIDPNWWPEPFSKLPEEDRPIFLSALPSPSREEVAELLKISPPSELPDGPFKQFTLGKLFEQIGSVDEYPLPLHCLDKHPLFNIATLGYSKLKLLIDYLGLYDLASEINKVIDSSHIKMIEEMLSPDQIEFVLGLKKKRDLISLGEMGVANWDGDLETLKEVLSKRGLYRLAKAMADIPTSLKWYIEHHLHPDQAEAFHELSIPIRDPEMKELLLKEVLDCLEYMQKGAS